MQTFWCGPHKLIKLLQLFRDSSPRDVVGSKISAEARPPPYLSIHQGHAKREKKAGSINNRCVGFPDQNTTPSDSSWPGKAHVIGPRTVCWVP